MKTLGRVIGAFVVLSLFAFATFVAAADSEQPSDTAKDRISEEAMKQGKTAEIAPVPEEKEKETSSPKGGWSDKLTGKEILKIEMEVETDDDLDFLRNLGLSCCSSIGACKCEVTLEQANQIKAQRIRFRIDKEEEKSQEQNELWEMMSRRVDRVTLGPHQVIMASMRVETYEDLEFLREIGVECCADTGVCRCRIDKEQWKQVGSYGFRYGARVIDTLESAKETKPKSDKVIPPKPKPKPEPDKSHDQSQMDTTKIFHLKVKIKTEEEEEIIQRIGLCRGKKGRKECSCHATSEQVEELKKEGIEFEIRRRSKRFGK